MRDAGVSPDAASSAGPQERFVLAVDLGTGGPKVGFVSMAGRVAWQTHLAVATERGDGGVARQDAEEWWTLICDAVRRSLGDGVVRADQVEAVCCTGQWASTVPTDDAGNPVGPCILWQDTRGARYVRAAIGGPIEGYAPAPLARWIRRTGGAPSPSGGDPIAHILHLERDEPEVAAAARWYLEPVDYLTMRFTGVAAGSHASMLGAWLTDNRHLDVLAYDADLAATVGVDLTKLPPLHPTGAVVGRVQPAVARALGLTDAVRVITGIPDLHSAACGAGAVRDFDTHLAISTSAWIGLPVPFKKTDLFRQIASVPGLGGASYLVANNHETGGLCLQWLRDEILADPTIPYDELTALAAGAAPGAGGAIFTPWLNGERSPVSDRRARGGFHNLSLRTTQADLVRAVLEGVAFNNRWLHDAVERFAGRQLDPIRLIGGGAASDLWAQIHADVMDRTIERVVEPLHANLRGAAVFAGLSLGAIRPEDVRSLVEVDRVFTPDPANRATYQRLYDEFPGLYTSQKGMFARLNGSARRRRGLRR